jgi:signal transduction histidine kinase
VTAQPRRPWLLFGVGLVLAAVGLGWLSTTLVRLDGRALLAENSRLALWRMDLALARLLATESARPSADFLSGAHDASVRLRFDLSPAGSRTTPASPEELARVSALAPRLLVAALPVAMGNADGTRDGEEFNRRNFALNNLAATTAMAPDWFGDELLLTRRVRMPDGAHVQGVWLRWPELGDVLLREVKDLLPEAQLEPVKGAARSDASMLASVPLRLVPGRPADVDASRTPIAWVLAAAWLALVLVAIALGVLLFGTLALDARRAAFVSAVTHELRTPLTTFKLYAEMLEAGMVPEEKRSEYLRTLSQEANRLGALVENVLAYAKVEQGRAPRQLEVLEASALLERVVPRLVTRAGEALKVEPIPAVVVRAERMSVEQILFNLVDNGCKYAPGAALSLGFEVTADQLIISVTDEGPGVAAGVALFEPFRKSAAQAADSAQGIGLGLALSRGLARAMGGELRRAPAVKGSRFELSLRRGA